MIICENVSKSYNGKNVLENLCLKIEEHGITSIIGLSGCGKTTLLNIIAGLLKPDSGRVFLKQVDITGKCGYVSYMMQKDLLFEHITVIDNVALPLILKGKKKKQAREEVSNLFKIFDIDGTQKLYPKELSGGMRQRAAFLRTYVNSSEIILLDEPFNSLDSVTKHKMQEWLLHTVKKLNLCVLLVTHDIDEAIKLSREIYILNAKGGNLIKLDRPFNKMDILKIMSVYIHSKNYSKKDV